VEVAKSVGFNSLLLAAIGLDLSFIDTPWLAAGKFIIAKLQKVKNPSQRTGS
jgi:hypothetical protein